MLDVSKEFNEAVKASNRRFETRIKIGNTIYTKKDINNWVYTSGSISGENLQIGSTFSNSIKIEFCSILENIKELTEITIEVGIATYDADYNYDNIPPEKVGSAKVGFAKLIHYRPTVFEYVPLGTFYVTSCDPDRNEKKTIVEASDRFVFMENEYVSDLTYPAKIRDVALEIANKSGSVINESNFAMIGTSLIMKPEGYTYRQALGLIAQFEAGYARFNRDNQLEIKQLVDPKYSIAPAEYFQKGLTKNELMYQVGGISCTVSVQTEEGTEQVTYFSGSNTGPQITLENKVMTQNLLDSIYQKIKSLNFYPFTLKWRGNPALETGDWITLADRDGTLFKTPNLSYILTFSGGLTATSSADTNSSAQTVSSYSPPLNQIIKDLNSRVDAAGKNSVYDGNEEPPYPKVGDLWFKKNGPDDEIWIYSKLEDGTYDWVLQTSTRLSDEIQDKIDNSVPSDEIVKTINLSEEMDGKEWLKITGAKIWLTDQTRIDDAIIQDAMIGNLSASKLTAGTINASDVNIINLNASNISTGSLNAIDITGSTIKGSIIISAGDDFTMTQDNGAITWKTNGDDKEIFKFYAAPWDLKRGIIQLEVYEEGAFSIKSKKTKEYFASFYDTSEGMTAYSSVNNLTIAGYDPKSPSFYTHSLRIDKNQFAYKNMSGTNNPRILIQKSGEFDIGSDDSYIRSTSSKIRVKTSLTEFVGSTKIIGSSNISDNLSITGNLMVIGSKNSLVSTSTYGQRLLNAYETPEYLFADYGKARTDENGMIKVDIDPIFLETVNTDSKNYHVFVSPYGQGSVWVEDVDIDSFVIKSDIPNMEVSWNIVAYRRYYENVRLDHPQEENEEGDIIDESRN